MALVAPFSATAVCSGPTTESLDISSLVTRDTNRWSAAGEPTLYLAGDVGVALAEVGRHWDQGASRLSLWQVELELITAVDLRRSPARTAAGIADDPRWFLDGRRCREAARRFRSAGCDGLIVPSAAFLDDPARWNAVLFVDQVADLARAVRAPRPTMQIGPARDLG